MTQENLTKKCEIWCFEKGYWRVLCVGHLQLWRNCEITSVCHDNWHVITGSSLRSLIVSFFLCLMKKKTFVVVMIKRGSLNMCFFCMSWCESFKSFGRISRELHVSRGSGPKFITDWCGDFWWLYIVLFTQFLHSVLHSVIIPSPPVCKYRWFIQKKKRGRNKINAIFCLTFFLCNKALNLFAFV